MELLFCRDDRGCDSVSRVFKFPPQNRSLSRTTIEFNEAKHCPPCGRSLPLSGAEAQGQTRVEETALTLP
jgi:hypothetical protein